MRHGEGKFISRIGYVFQGKWKNDLLDGVGVIYNKNGEVVYQGEFQKNQFHGRGVLFNRKA